MPARVNTLLVSGADAAQTRTASARAGVRRRAQLEDVGLNAKALDARTRRRSRSAPTPDCWTSRVRSGEQGARQEPACARSRCSRISPTRCASATAKCRTRSSPRLNDPNAPRATRALRTIRTAIVLNDWAAKELNARAGRSADDGVLPVGGPGQLVTRSRDVPRQPRSCRSRRATGTWRRRSRASAIRRRSSDWDPPFPVDLRRVRPQDERYWEQYRTTPKAFVPLEAGQRLWRSRYGAVTSMRVAAADGRSLGRRARRRSCRRLRAAIDPLALGLTVRDVRAREPRRPRAAPRTSASTSSTSASSWSSRRCCWRRCSSSSASSSACARSGCCARSGSARRRCGGCSSAKGCCWPWPAARSACSARSATRRLIMTALRTWWVDAVGTTALTLHVSPASLVGGAVGGVVAAVVCIWWTLRALGAHLRAQPAGRRDLTRQLRRRRSAGRRTRRLGGCRARRCCGCSASRCSSAGAGGVDRARRRVLRRRARRCSSRRCACSRCLLRRPVRRALDGRGWQPVSRLGLAQRDAIVRAAACCRWR